MIPYVNPAATFRAPEYRPTRQLSNDAKVRELEEKAAAYLGSQHAVATSSGTTALFVMFRALGLAGKKILMPAYTWRSTAEAAIMASARPVFADVDEDSFCLVLPANMVDDTDAICANDCFGCPADYERLLIDGPDVPLLFDSASAFGARYQGRPIGGMGTARIFSLSPTKVLTASEGGLITCNSSSLADELRSIRRWAGRMTEYNAACALEGLKRLPDVLEQKQDIAVKYKGFAERVGLGFQKIPDWARSTYKDFPVVFSTTQERDAARRHLEAAGVETRVYFTPANKFVAWNSQERYDLTQTYNLYLRSLCLPAWPGVDQDYVIERLEDICRDGMNRKMNIAIG